MSSRSSLASSEGEQRIELLAFRGGEMDPTAQQQPPFTFHDLPDVATLPKEFGAPHLVHRCVRMLHHMKLVVDNPTARRPRSDAIREGLPHIHAGGLDPRPLAPRQLLAKERVERRLEAVAPKPHGLAALKIADDRQ